MAESRPGDGTRPPRVGDWTRARNALKRAFEAVTRSKARVSVGRVIKVGSGLYRYVYAGSVALDPDAKGLSGTYVAMIPKQSADEGLPERTRRELHTLERLAAIRLPFRVPQAIAAVNDPGGLALVRTFLEGAPLGLQAGGHGVAEPWEVLGELAAAIHRVDPWMFNGVLEDPGSRRAHAASRLAVFDGLEEPVVGEALRWARAHLPPEEPASLLHGDLFGRNVYLKPDQPPAVIDWELAQLGDPAHDLAVVTRGSRRPFGVEDGLARLIAAYAAHGGSRRVEAVHVHVHALCLATEVYRHCLRYPETEPPEMALGRLRKLLEQAKAL